MGQYVEIITDKWKEIIYLNLSGLDEQNQLKAVGEMDWIFSRKNDILAFTNIKNRL